jgi:bacillopeptidase F (M6 metalloprotease family)/subtilisin family serine protease
MILGARHAATKWWRRVAGGGLRGGLALVISALLPLQASAISVSGPKAPTSPVGGGPGAGKAVTASRFPSVTEAGASAKVDKRVSDAFTSARQQTYLVKLWAGADVVGAANQARKEARPAQREVSARSAVIKELRKTAESSQQGVLSHLAQLKQKGLVTEYEPFWIANIVAVTSTRDAMQQLAKRSDVAKIIPNAQVKLVEQMPGNGKIDLNKTNLSKTNLNQKSGTQTAAGTPGTASVEWGIQRVGAPMVWNQFGITGQGAVVASMDTGVDWNHPALHDRWRGYDPATGTTDPTYSWFDAVNGQAMPYDDHGHGTHTTGTAVGQEGDNVIGVAPGARWIGVKILNSAGSGTSEDILAAGQWLLAPGGDPSKAPDVVNSSWSGGPGLDEWFRDVVIAWRAAGIFPAFANGNDGPGDATAAQPGNYPESFAVGATDINDNLAGFSSRGPSPYGEIKPEVSAPGVNVRSSVPGGGYEGGWNGTSMATPHVTGTVALLRSANAALTVDQIEQLLIASADPKTDSRYTGVPNNGYGNGILNAYNAVAMVTTGVGTISGRVVTGGDDFDPPVITHTAVSEAFKHTPVDIAATISDNVSVTGAQLKFRMPGMSWWGVVDMQLTGGDFKSGTYAASIPADVTGDNTVDYFIVARDYGGNDAYHGTASHPHSVALLSGLQPGWSTSFEGSNPGWMHGGAGDNWEIGVPTSGPMAAHTGSNVAATGLAGDYQDNAGAFLMTPPIDLSGGPAALRFWQWYDTENGFDQAVVLATGDNGQNWDVLAQYTGASSGWQEVAFDLSPYAGNPSVYLAFYLASDGSVTGPGWYIDDVSLAVDSTAPDAPANLTAAPLPSGAIGLAWAASSAGDLAHYTVYRSTTSGSGYAPLGPSTETTFTDGTAAAGTTYYYVVTATDLFGNESARSNQASATPVSGVVAFQDDMESGDGSWTHSGAADSWQRGTPTAGPSGAHSGTNLWGTNLGGNYAPDTNASLMTPPVSLAGMTTVSLQFAQWYSMEKDFDNGRVEVSADGGSTWTTLATYTSPSYSGTPVGWEVPVIDLSSYAGQTVQIRFRMQSDSSVQFAGWYIDDVRIAGLSTAGAPVNRPLSVTLRPVKAGAKGKPSATAIKPQIKMARPAGPSIKRDYTGSSITVSGIGIASLPLDATVTVVETGRVIRTDPARGTFTMAMPAGTYTLRAEAYGYFPQEKTVTVVPDGNANATFVLNPIPHGFITGQVTNVRTGEPLMGATVSVAEDLRIAPVHTGADGRYTLEVLQGDYTAEFRAAGYYPDTSPVSVSGGATATRDMALEPFVGLPGEIAYDDGSPDNAMAFFQGGNGWAVRMSPPSPGQSMMIRGGRFYIWDQSWPTPGGNTFQAAIYEAKADGTPGRLLAGPVRIAGATRGAWNDVDFSPLGLIVRGDFFMAYIQDGAYPNTTGLSLDESTPPADRVYQMVSGTWSKWTDNSSFMIRALVSYEVGAPAITAPADGSFTSHPAAQVSGTAQTGTTVVVSLNGAQAGTTTTDATGHWSASVTLAEGANTLTAVATVSGGTTRPSAPVSVTLDTLAPNLTLTAPADGHGQSSKVLSVAGQVADAHMASLTVNGQAATVSGDGTFSMEVVGHEGANIVTVTATDRAGNATTLTRTVNVDSGAPILTNLQPASNATVNTGDLVTVAFDSEPGLALAGFQIAIGGAASQSTGKAASLNLEPGEMALHETSAGHYEGQWTVPAGMAAPSAYVRIRAVDAASNETRMTAPGVLTVVANQRPTAVIVGPTSGRRNTSLAFDGRSSRDPDGRIVSYRWNYGDGTNGSGGRVSHRWTRTGTYTVTLTVTDDKGATGTITQTLTITN